MLVVVLVVFCNFKQDSSLSLIIHWLHFLLFVGDVLLIGGY